MYRHHAHGPATTIRHDTPGWIVVAMEADRPGMYTELHSHRFDHWMECKCGVARILIDGTATIVRAGGRYMVGAHKEHKVWFLQTGTVVECQHEIRAENGQLDPDAFSPEGIPVHWLMRLTDTWGPGDARS